MCKDSLEMHELGSQLWQYFLKENTVKKKLVSYADNKTKTKLPKSKL